MADFTPPDMIFDILLRLPVKDLLRYRCVSTAWRSLIDDPDFIKLHLRHSKEANSNMALFLLSNVVLRINLDTFPAAIKLSHPFDGCYSLGVLGSCNGLLALLNRSRKDVCLWNPSTGRYRKLPTTNRVDLPSGFVLRYFNQICGFGHDPINDDYKLVRITQFVGVHHEDSFHTQIEVYSAKENAWRRKNCPFPYFLESEDHAALVGNALHWAVSQDPKLDVLDTILAFDLVTEEYHKIPQPEYEKANNNLNRLGDLGGSLCVAYNYYLKDRSMIFGRRLDRTDIWVMKEYGKRESWIKLFSMEPPEAIGNFCPVTPIAYLKSGDQVLLKQGFKKLITYDLITKKANRLQIPDRNYLCFRTCLCVGSLVGFDDDWDEVKGNRKKKNHKKRNFNAKSSYKKSKKQKTSMLNKCNAYKFYSF